MSIRIIVIGSQGRTGVRRALLGSVAEAVMRNAPCPVLVARAKS
jgi:nucleotide-binding universal stress UspA family protein